MKMTFDAVALREECQRSARAGFGIVYGEVTPGEYATQRGSFEMSTDSIIIGVCVWDQGQVEIHSLSKSGETKEIETLEKATLAGAAKSIF